MISRGTVAAGRRSPTNVIGDFSAESAKAAGARSNQEKSQTQSAKFRNVPVAKGKYNEGEVVRMQANTKGTGVVGRPSVLGQAGRDFTKPAVQNPDGASSRPGSRRK